MVITSKQRGLHDVIYTLEFVKDYFIWYSGIISFYEILKFFLLDLLIFGFIISHSCAASGCDQKFNTKSNLKKHFEHKHENQQKQYVVSKNDILCLNSLNIFMFIVCF